MSNEQTETFLAPIEKARGADHEARICHDPKTVRQSAYARESRLLAFTGRLWLVCFEDQQTGQEADVAAGDDHAHS